MRARAEVRGLGWTLCRAAPQPPHQTANVGTNPVWLFLPFFGKNFSRPVPQPPILPGAIRCDAVRMKRAVHMERVANPVWLFLPFFCNNFSRPTPEPPILPYTAERYPTPCGACEARAVRMKQGQPCMALFAFFFAKTFSALRRNHPFCPAGSRRGGALSDAVRCA